MLAEALDYYASPSPITDPGPHAGAFDGLPTAIPDLVQVALGLILHPVAAKGAGMTLAPERTRELALRSVARMVARILELDPRPLTEPRPPERRLIGNCRDSAALFCAMLRYQGRPTRARNGFATYFAPDFFIDHWICEYWRADESRWVGVDPDVGPDPQRFGFDTADVPADRFLTAGRAWQRLRQGAADPARFGLPDAPDNGLGWVASQVVRDLAALNKRELLAWDTWALGHTAFGALSDEEARFLDRVAALTAVGGNDVFPRIRALYESDSRLTVPPVIKTIDAVDGGPAHDFALEPTLAGVAATASSRG